MTGSEPRAKKKAWVKSELPKGSFKDKTEGNESEKKPESSSASGRASKLYDGK